MKDDGVIYKIGKKWSDCTYILKVDPTDFADGLNMRYERMRKQGRSQGFWSNWRVELLFPK